MDVSNVTLHYRTHEKFRRINLTNQKLPAAMQAVKDKVSGMPASCSSSAQLPYGAAANIELDLGSNSRSNLHFSRRQVLPARWTFS